MAVRRDERLYRYRSVATIKHMSTHEFVGVSRQHPGLVSRKELRDLGVSRTGTDRQVAVGELVAIHRGLYVVKNADLTVEERWRLELVANLRRAGAGAALSHRTAAVLHGFEGVHGLPTDLTVPWRSGFIDKPAIRSRTLTDDLIVMVDGLPVTSMARTLCDLGRFLSPDAVEAALNSALRGTNRRRPDLWNEELLEELREFCRTRTTRRGIATIRLVLRRRGAARPTGSYPETLLLLAARRQGIDLAPQFEVAVKRLGQTRPESYFPDLSLFVVRLTIEIEGVLGHSAAEQIDRDARRQNVLSEGFHVLRFQAGRILSEPDACAREVARTVENLRRHPHNGADRVTQIDPWTCILQAR